MAVPRGNEAYYPRTLNLTDAILTVYYRHHKLVKAQRFRNPRRVHLAKDSYTTGDLAKMCGIKYNTFRSRIQRGRIPDAANRVGDIRVWTQEEAEALIAELGCH